MSNSSPLVSVLMPVYNGDKYLREAIESILNQTFTDFEFLIINDGSTDDTENIILSYTDARIRYIKNEENLKLIATLNKGLDLAQGKYIARMDADDISICNRLEVQFNFMESNPQIGLLGTNILDFQNSIENYREIRYKTKHDEIKFKLFFDTHFPHPSAFIRKNILNEKKLRFNPDSIHAEDFELWNKLVAHTKLHILPEFLVAKRSHSDQISLLHRQFQLQKVNEIRCSFINRVFSYHDIEVIQIFNDFLNGTLPNNVQKTNQLLDFIVCLYKKNLKLNYYRIDLFEKFCSNSFWHILSSNTHFGIIYYSKYHQSSLVKKNNLSFSTKLKWFLKSLFKVSSPNNKVYYSEQ
jgi:glycosyltransferase involved in cell wall biosynthesis